MEVDSDRLRHIEAQIQEFRKQPRDSWIERWLHYFNSQKRTERLRIARTKGTHTKEEWLALLASVNGVCPRCKSDRYGLVKDHIVPLFMGGSDALSNIQPLCHVCNAQKSDETINWLTGASA